MIMKILLALITISSLVVCCSMAQLLPLPTKPWNATIKIIGEDGQQVSNAGVSIAYTKPPYSYSDNPIYHGIITGTTDSNGVFSATHDDRSGSLGFGVNKQGYYTTRNACRLRDPEENANDRNISITLLLKKIGDPIAMYAKRQEMKIEKEDEPMGFDLKVGDWVTPNGKGEHTDMFFTAHRKIISERKYDGTLTVTFPNNGDGLVIAPTEPDDGSEFKTSRTASENGYQPELDLHYSNTNQPQAVFGYFIRVRTELDQDGKIQSTFYGKIPGNFRFFAGTKAPKAGMAFTYYLNPTANDRNVEFNPKRNMIRDLSPLEEVKEP